MSKHASMTVTYSWGFRWRMLRKAHRAASNMVTNFGRLHRNAVFVAINSNNEIEIWAYCLVAEICFWFQSIAFGATCYLFDWTQEIVAKTQPRFSCSKITLHEDGDQ